MCTLFIHAGIRCMQMQWSRNLIMHFGRGAGVGTFVGSGCGFHDNQSYYVATHTLR